jgi:ABC-type multidrug transport system fused ATPase/permease subunit
MTTLEIRQVITEHLSHIDDESFLNALKTIVESKVSDGEYKLSDFQRKRIDIARHELKNGLSISHDDLQNEINQWLKSK